MIRIRDYFSTLHLKGDETMLSFVLISVNKRQNRRYCDKNGFIIEKKNDKIIKTMFEEENPI